MRYISSFDYHGEKASKYFDQHGSNDGKTTFRLGGTGHFTDIKTWFWNVNELFWFNYFLLQTRMYTKLHCLENVESVFKELAKTTEKNSRWCLF